MGMVHLAEGYWVCVITLSPPRAKKKKKRLGLGCRWPLWHHLHRCHSEGGTGELYAPNVPEELVLVSYEDHLGSGYRRRTGQLTRRTGQPAALELQDWQTRDWRCWRRRMPPFEKNFTEGYCAPLGSVYGAAPPLSRRDALRRMAMGKVLVSLRWRER